MALISKLSLSPVIACLDCPSWFLHPHVQSYQCHRIRFCCCVILMLSGCRTGMYLDVMGAGGMSAQCRDCPKGHWCPGGTSAAVSCPVNMGTLTINAKRATACGGQLPPANASCRHSAIGCQAQQLPMTLADLAVPSSSQQQPSLCQGCCRCT